METNFISGIRLSSHPTSYVRPDHERPKLSEVMECENVPVIDSGCEEESQVIKQIGSASREYGLFQVINHGEYKESMGRILESWRILEIQVMKEEMKLEIDLSKKRWRRICREISGNRKYRLKNYERVRQQNLTKGVEKSADNGSWTSLAATILLDRPSEAIEGYDLNSYGEGSSSLSEAPQAFNNGSAVDRVRGINRAPLKNKVSIDIQEQYVSIDIPSAVDRQWEEYIGRELDRKKEDYTMISESTLAITGQAIGTLLSSAVSGSSHPSWTANFVAVATVFGIAFTLAGIGLRRVKPRLSGITIKLGAVATASAIILALGLTVVPAVAWTAGAVACLLIAVGVTMA